MILDEPRIGYDRARRAEDQSADITLKYVLRRDRVKDARRHVEVEKFSHRSNLAGLLSSYRTIQRLQ